MYPVNTGINFIKKPNILIYCYILGLMFITTVGTTGTRNHKNHHRGDIDKITDNFISYETLTDGETEKYIHFNGLIAKETSVRQPGDETSRSMKLRQVADGSQIIQIIYGSDGGLKNCEQVKQRAAVRGFMLSFKETLKNKENVTILQPGVTLPEDISSWLDLDTLETLCKRNRRLLKKVSRRKSHNHQHNNRYFKKHPIDNDHRTNHQRSNNETVDLKQSTPYNSHRRKHRADSFIERSGLLLAPGTKWCGHSDAADTISSLGPFAKTDRCCRNHDLCPFNIGGFERKYNFFNYRPFTVSHCSCDSRFRACLKMAKTGTAHLVGKMFFNVVQTKCFVLKSEKTCVKRKWNGKCLSYENRKQAHLRDNPTF